MMRSTRLHESRRAALLCAAMVSGLLLGCTMSVERMLSTREEGDPQRTEAALKKLTAVAREERGGRRHLRRRCAAVESMAYLESGEVIGVLGDLGTGVRNPAVRSRVAWALGQRDDSAAAEQLLRMAEDARARQTLVRILEGLCKFPDYLVSTRDRQDRVLDVLNRAQSRHPECPQMRNLAGLLFAEIKSLAGCLRALEAAGGERDVQKQFNALRWVGDMLLDHGEEIDTADPHDPYDVAVGKLEDLASSPGEPREIRYRALWYLGMLGDSSTARTLLGVATSGQDRAMRMLGIWGVWRTDPEMFRRQIRCEVPEELLRLRPENYLEARRALPDLAELDVQRLIKYLERRGTDR